MQDDRDGNGLEIQEIEEPRGPLTIAVVAAGVGYPDLLMRDGKFQLRQPPPFSLGWEAAGVVTSAPAGSRLGEGDRVMAMAFGAFADRVGAEESATFRLPDQISFEEGAALPLNYLTAVAALQRRGRLKAGEHVLVHGAGGGVGSAVVQVAKGMGAHVTALASAEAKAAVALASGADAVIEPSGEWWRELNSSSGGVDLVIDPVGGDRLVGSLRSLKSEGRVVVVGFASGGIPSVEVNRLLLRNAELSGCTWGVLADPPEAMSDAMHLIGEFVDQGWIRPIVGATYPFDALPSALDDLAERRACGKLVLTVNGHPSCEA